MSVCVDNMTNIRNGLKLKLIEICLISNIPNSASLQKRI